MGDLIHSENEEEGRELSEFLDATRYTKYTRFVFAALGAIPWVGAFFAASSALHAEREQARLNEIYRRWLEEHATKIRQLSTTLSQIMQRLEVLGAVPEERLQEDSYLDLVRVGFRAWDEATSSESRERIRRTLTNAAGTRICSDDVVRLFLLWQRTYDDLHMRVVRAVYENPGATRARIWEQVHGEDVREDSPEAGLFRLMIRDLNIGGIIRQWRDKTPDGRFLKKRVETRRARKETLESSFEDSKPWVLSELGEQFVHYAMNEIVPRVAGDKPAQG